VVNNTVQVVMEYQKEKYASKCIENLYKIFRLRAKSKIPFKKKAEIGFDDLFCFL
jgi:hypothetical protein